MNIEITLGGALARQLPEGYTSNQFSFECGPNTPITELLSELGISDDHRLMCILNGSLVQADAFVHTLLADGDVLSLVPPITAG